MRVIEFQKYLDADSALRVRFETDRGEAVKFAVQLECRFREGWVAVVRYDTAHGFAHCDRLNPYGVAVKEEMATQDYNEAPTLAITDLMMNWQGYRRRYEEWLSQA